MRHHLKFGKQLSFTHYLLLFPIVGFLDLKDDLRRDTINEFTGNWVCYLFITAFWCFIVGGIIYLIYASPVELLITIAVFLGIIFLLVGLPRVIYKLANRKARK